jgi:hypothetical protein
MFFIIGFGDTIHTVRIGVGIEVEIDDYRVRRESAE